MDYLGYAISAASGGGGGGSSFDPLLIDSDLVPTDTETYDVGRSLKRWRNGNFTAVNSTISVTAPTVTLTALASNDPTVIVTSINGLSANKYTVNGGTNQQYLMADGSRLQFSSNSGNSNFYLYKSGTSQSATPPAGFITYNNDVQDDATVIYISHLTRDGVDIDVFFNQITPITEVYIQDQNLSDNFIQYNVLSTPTPVPNQQVAINVQKRSSDGTGKTEFPNGHNIIMSFFTNGPEVDSRLTTLETKTANQTVVGGVTTFPSVNAPIMDSASTLAFGTNTQTGLTIGRSAAATNLRGSSIITTGNFNPVTTNTGTIGTSTVLYNTVFAGIIGTNNIDVPVIGQALTVGGSSASSLILGRVGANTNIRGLITLVGGTTCLNLGLVPYINGSATAPVPANPRLVLAKYIMPVNNNINTGTVILNTLAGGMGGLSTVASEQLVGTTWRYKFDGFAINAALTNSLSLQLSHAGGTQNLVTWTYGASTPANANFHGEIVMFFTAIGATVSPQVSGHVNFVNSTSVSLQNVSVSLFSPNLYSTTAPNSNNIQIVANPTTGFQYTVSNFTCEWLR
jgi:hypothetical protein